MALRFEKADLFADELEACEGAAELDAIVRGDGVCHVGRDDGGDGNGALGHGPIRLPRLADEIEQQHANLVSGKQPVGALAVWHGHAAAVTVGVGANEKVGAQALTVGKAERHRLADLGVRVGAGREMAVWLCLLGDEREISDTKRSANPFDAFAAGAIERRVDDA